MGLGAGDGSGPLLRIGVIDDDEVDDEDDAELAAGKL
jgi:hypothetical protein